MNKFLEYLICAVIGAALVAICVFFPAVVCW